MYSRRLQPVSLEEALAVACPKCLQAPGELCVYVNQVIRPEYIRSSSSRRTLGRVGTPTLAPHPERRYEARMVRPHKRRTYVKSARQTSREFEVQEYMRLQCWLREHSDIFREHKIPSSTS
jgi:hypothetical protein